MFKSNSADRMGERGVSRGALGLRVTVPEPELLALAQSIPLVTTPKFKSAKKAMRKECSYD